MRFLKETSDRRLLSVMPTEPTGVPGKPPAMLGTGRACSSSSQLTFTSSFETA